MIQRFLNFVKSNKEIISFLGTGIAIVATGVWTVIEFMSPEKESINKEAHQEPANTTTIDNSGGSITAGRDFIVASGDINIEFSKEELKEYLEERKLEILNQAADDFKKEAELVRVSEKLSNLQDAYEDQKMVLEETIRLLKINSGIGTVSLRESEELESQLEERINQRGDNAVKLALQLGKLSESRVDFEKAFRAYSLAATLSPDNSEARQKAAQLAIQTGRHELAIKHLEARVRIARNGYESDEALLRMTYETELLHSLEAYGAFLAFKKQNELALEAYTEALSLIREDGDEENPTPRVQGLEATILRIRADIDPESESGNDDAIVAMERHLKTTEEQVGKAHYIWVDEANSLAEALKNSGYYEKSEIIFKEAIKYSEQMESPDQRLAPIIKINYSSLQQIKGNYDTSDDLIDEALEHFEPNDRIPINVLSNHARFYNEHKEYERAISTLDKAIIRAQLLHEAGDTVLPKLLYMQAESSGSAKDYQTGIQALNQLIAFLESEHSEVEGIDEEIDFLEVKRDVMKMNLRSRQ